MGVLSGPGSTGLAEIPPACLAAVQEIRLLQSMLAQVAQFAEARIMERLWEIRRAVADDDAYRRLAERHLDMDGATALRYATTWEGARQNRALRELAQQTPQQAMVLVQSLATHGLDDIGDDDAEVAALLGRPPKQRQQAIRDLLAHREQVVSGRHPADQEEIRVLTAERDAALDALQARAEVVRLDETPPAQARALMEQVQGLAQQVGQAAEAAQALPAGALSAHTTDQMYRYCDLLISSAEAMLAALGEAPAAES